MSGTAEGAAGEGAAAEQAAAGDKGDQEEQREEDRARLAADLLEAGELLDFQVVGVVAAGPRLDGAVAGAAGVGVAADEVGRGSFDRGADGGAGRREQRPQFGRVDGVGGAGAAGGDDPFGAQEDGEEAHDLVDGLDRRLAHEVGQWCAGGCRGRGGRRRTAGRCRGVGEQGVDGAGLVDAVRVGRGAADAVDGAALAGGGLGVAQDGVGGDEDPVARGVDAPAQVDVVAHEGQPAVEAAEFLEHVAADEHAGGGDGQHGPDLVVLALVLFVRRSSPVQRRPLRAMVTPTSRSCFLSYQPRSLGPTTAAYASESATRSSSARASGSGAQSSWSSHSHWTGSPCGSSGMS